jgi:hypothetical protein
MLLAWDGRFVSTMWAESAMLLRDASHFQWGLLPIFLLVLYVYNEQIAARRWSVVLGGLTFWLMDGFNEIVNALIAHFSSTGPVWATPGGQSSLLLLIGLNSEISLMFAVMGLMAMRMLPDRADLRILGLNNRLCLALVNSVLCVLVEVWLNHVGQLVWVWPYWNARFPWLIFLLGYLPFFLVGYWVHDLRLLRHQLLATGLLALLVLGAGCLFGGMGWI